MSTKEDGGVPTNNAVLVFCQGLASFALAAAIELKWLKTVGEGRKVGMLKAVLVFRRAMLIPKVHLAVENLALRQQLAVFKQSVKRPKLWPRDRVFWVWLFRLWRCWRSALVIVQPETVVKWHRKGFRLFWTWKSRRRKPGRPRIEREIRELIRRMSREKPTWGAPRIRSELLLLGHEVAEANVAKYMVRQRKPPSQTWRTFLANHVPEIAACDFFTVPTVTFRVLYVFIVLRHDRRRLVRFNVTSNSTSEWTAQQIVEAFPYETASRFLIRDRDGIYGDYFKKRIKDMGTEDVLIAPRSPWQTPYCERVIGSTRRECLNHIIILNEVHLKRILTSCSDYYHDSRPHLSLDRNSPTPRHVELPSKGEVVAVPQVGGLHHLYTRHAA